jgi:dihydroneopterin aldolase
MIGMATGLHERMPAADAATYSVVVRDLPVEALIGINADEQDRRQQLIVSVDAALHISRPLSGIADTVDYCAIAEAARLVAQDHVGLIEQYARLVGERCLALGPVESVTVSVTKPDALRAGLAATVVRLERPAGANIIPFAPADRSGEHLVRFAFGSGINLHAQHELARIVRQLADTMRGFALDDLSFEPQTGEWTGRITMSGKGSPRVENAEFPARLPRRDAQ